VGWSKASDVRWLARLAIGYLLTGLLPRRLDRWLGPRLLDSGRLIPRRLIRTVAERMRFVLGDTLGAAEAHEEARAWAAMCYESRWLRYRALHGRGPAVETSVEGLAYVTRAAGEGRGSILWGMEFCDTLVVKIALHRAGVRLVHLSTANHGLAAPPTKLGLRIVSPLYCAAENRFLDERVVMPTDGSLHHMLVLRQRLKEARCVYISGERLAVRRNVAATLMGRQAFFAPGAPALAWTTQAELLPVHVVRSAPFRYRVVIDAPIAIDRTCDLKRAVVEPVQEFAARLGRRVAEYPAGWMWLGGTVETWRATAGAEAPATRIP
jgi:lauroyl/myristoyl acyltransferase